jgi:hypothetical protein
MPFFGKKSKDKKSTKGTPVGRSPSDTLASSVGGDSGAGSTASLKPAKNSKGAQELLPPSGEALANQLLRSKEGIFPARPPIFQREFKAAADLAIKSKVVSQEVRMTRYHPKQKPTLYKVSVDFTTFEVMLAPESQKSPLTGRTSYGTCLLASARWWLRIA